MLSLPFSSLWLRWSLLLSLLLSTTGTLHAQLERSLPVAELRQSLRTLEQQRWTAQQPRAELARALSRLAFLQQETERCLAQTAPDLKRVEATLKQSEGLTIENARLKAELSRLQRRRTELGEQLLECRLLQSRAAELTDHLQTMLREQLQQRLTQKDVPRWELLRQLQEEPAWSRLLQTPLRLPETVPWDRVLMVVLPAFFAWGVAVQVRRLPLFDQAGHQVFRAVATHFPWGAALLSMWGSLSLMLPGEASTVLEGLLLLLLLRLGLSGLLPDAKGVSLLGLDQARARRLRSGSMRFAGLLWLREVLMAGAVPVPAPWEGLLQSGVMVLAALALLPLLRQVSVLPGPWEHRAARWAVGVLVGVVLLAEITGYRVLAAYLLYGLAGTLGTFFLFEILRRGNAEVCDQLNAGTAPWARHWRKQLAVPQQAPFPGTVWLRTLVALANMVLALLFLLASWQLSETGSAWGQEFWVQGFALGEIRIIPTNVFLAGFFVVLIVSTSRWLRRQLRERWLRHTGLDEAERETMVTLIGYVATILAFLVGLGLLGIKLENIALIAGALSVGIGFGLQNIISNFISGLILLFERPIRTGDWVIVGAAEGTVKQIRIRSTVIETFDQAEIIVPNSELISAQVTNWTLENHQGRILVTVGVAYGSDVRRVEELLMEAAAEHPDVLPPGSELPPTVVFTSFGDSSLDFTLRCHTENVLNKIFIGSDLHFAIDAKFREAGVEIPFPQRDLHLRSSSVAGWGAQQAVPPEARTLPEEQD